MPSKSSKKKKNQQKQAPAKYVILPMSPVVTRSGARTDVVNTNNSATPPSLVDDGKVDEMSSLQSVIVP